jgi:hypothetical protein
MRKSMAVILVALAAVACSPSDSGDESLGADVTVADEDQTTGSAPDQDASTTASSGTAPADTATSDEAPPTQETTGGSGEPTAPADPSGDVECRVTSGTARYEGPCVFELAGSDGSFAVQKADESPMVDEVVVITVSIDGEGLAEVRGLTTDGINSRWGSAERSQTEPACWTGSDFEVCAF